MGRSYEELSHIAQSGGVISVSSREFDGDVLVALAKSAKEGNATITINDAELIDADVAGHISKASPGRVFFVYAGVQPPVQTAPTALASGSSWMEHLGRFAMPAAIAFAAAVYGVVGSLAFAIFFMGAAAFVALTVIAIAWARAGAEGGTANGVNLIIGLVFFVLALSALIGGLQRGMAKAEAMSPPAQSAPAG